jgi:glycine oxidase
VQVLVIGAGVIGCAVAHELTLRNAQVRVVDPRPVGGGATRASAGMLAPYSEGHHAPLLRLGIASLALWDQFVERVRSETGLPFGYERTGTLQVASDGPDTARLAGDAQRYSTQRVSCTAMAGGALHAFEPALGSPFDAGIFLPAQGWVDALALTHALVDAARQRGAQFTTERVLAIDDHQRGVAITTSAGRLEAEALVLAAGSWSSAVAGVTGWPPPVKPVRGQLLHLKAPSRLASRILWDSSCYVVPRPDGTTLVGATVEDVGFDEHPTAGGVRGLLDAVCRLLPSASDAVFQEVRVGLRPKTPDELPIIGRSSTMRHVFHATGHYRNGVLLTPLTAKLVGGLIVDGSEPDELTVTNPARFGL